MSAAAAAASSFAPTGTSGEKAKAIAFILIVVLIIIVVIIAIKKGMSIFDTVSDVSTGLLEKLGLKKSAEEEAIDNEAAVTSVKANATDSPFNPTYYKSVPAGTAIFTSANAKTLADQVWNSVGIFSDDAEAGYAVIKQCTNWAKVSQICDTFQSSHGRDMYEWLKLKYDTTSQKDVLNKLVNYAFALPKT